MPQNAILNSKFALERRRSWVDTSINSNSKSMKQQTVLDLYFMEARAKLIDIAAFLDRVERADGESDFRLEAFGEALRELEQGNANRASRVLSAFSDPTSEPIPIATTKAACGAWPDAPAN